MIEGIRYLANLPPTWSNLPKISKSLANCISKISLIAIHLTLFNLIRPVALIGFCVGFTAKDQIDELGRNINMVFMNCITPLQKLKLAVGMTLFAGFTLPYTVIAVTFYLSATWGASLR